MIHKIESQGETLVVIWDDGSRSDFHARWLRDNCQSPTSVHATGQRLIETVDIPAELEIEAAHLSGDGQVTVEWRGDEHVSEFPSTWLYGYRAASASGATDVGAASNDDAAAQTLWNADLTIGEIAYGYDDVGHRLESERAWLACFAKYGVAILQGVPTESGMVTDVASLFGYVRETNYGRYFDVKSVINPNNLAYTGLALSPHTDNPYRDPVPTVQLLHCLDTEVSGGDSTLVDGFYLAHKLRSENRVAFELLSTVPVQFRFRDDETDLHAEKTIIGTDAKGDVNCISFNNRSIQPFRLPPEQMGAFYDAYTLFAQMVNDPQNQVAFKLGPGELFMVDNRRVLHGRTGYASNGSRHLQGCYADVDSLQSRLAVLERGRN